MKKNIKTSLSLCLAMSFVSLSGVSASAIAMTPVTPMALSTPTLVAPSTTTWDGSIRASSTVAGKSTPLTVSIVSPTGTHTNKVVYVEAYQNGVRKADVFLEGRTLTGTTSHTLSLPALAAGTYQLKLTVFDGPSAGSYAWGAPRLSSTEGNLVLTAPVATVGWSGSIKPATTVANKVTPLSVNVIAPTGTQTNKVVYVEAYQNGVRKADVFLEGRTLTGNTTHAMNLPALPAGTYQLKLTVFDGPPAGSYVWGVPRLSSAEGNLVLTAPITPAPVTVWSATATATSPIAGKTTPVSVKITSPAGTQTNKVVNVEAQRNGVKIAQAFVENVDLTGTTTRTINLPALASGDYQLVVMVFDGAWVTRTYTSPASLLRVAAAPVTTPTPTPTTPPVTSSTLYNAPRLQNVAGFDLLKNTPASVWAAGGSNTETRDMLARHSAAAQGKTMSVVVYNIPGRDGNNYSAGGVANLAEYRAYIDAIATGVGTTPVIYTIEPDALGLIGELTADKKTERIESIKYANQRLAQNPNAKIYVDASQWVGATEMAATVKSTIPAGGKINGIAVNVSAFNSTPNMVSYVNQVRAASGLPWTGIIDTSRNGVATATHWCNPTGQGIGKLPTLNTGVTNIDAFLWLKGPGESDGECGRGEPAAGQFWPAYAQGLIDRARF